MNKILLCLVASALPLASGLNQANISLKFRNILQGEWIENEQEKKNNLNSSQKFKKIKNIYCSKKIDIDLFNSSTNKTVAEINAKKIQKKYYLSLQNDYLYSEKQLENFIKTKFYSEKTSEYYLKDEDFYTFLDTKDFNGEITKNEMINFRSSWGVFNEQQVNSSTKFNFRQETLKKFIFLHDHNRLPKNLKLRQIDVEAVRPVKIGILPIVQIHQPPILNATFRTWKIFFNDSTNFKNNPYLTQDLIMPEGHNSGAEWWRGLVSAIGPIVAILGGGLGAIVTGTILKSLLTGALIGGISQIVSKIVENIENISIKDGISTVKKIYEKIMENNFKIWPYIMDFEDIESGELSMFLESQLWARANATSVWGSESKMNLFAVWGAVNSAIWYRVYN